MASPCSMPRRSPRRHRGSYPTHTHQLDRSSPLVNGYSAQALQGLQEDSSQQLPEPSTPDFDREALDENAENVDDDYPAPPTHLSYDPENSNDTVQDGSSDKTLSTDAPATEPSSTYATTTQPPSASAGTTRPPFAYALNTERASAYVPTTQPPFLYAPTTGPPPTHTSTPQQSISHIPRTCQVTSTAAPAWMHQPAADGAESVEINPAEAEKNKDLHRFFVHLNRLTVNQQKAVASAFGVIQQGNKKTRAARIFVVISGMMDRMNRTAAELLEEKRLEKGKNFNTEFERTVRRWGEREENTVVPPIAELEAQTGVRQHPPPCEQVEPVIDDDSDQEDTPDISPSGENVSLEEFARLMIIFRDVPEAARDLRKSGQDLQRQELDIHETRHAFWTDRIEGLFNDPSLLTSDRLDGELEHIDAGRPVTAFRRGSCLQNLFNKFRKEFALIYKRWNVSGNLDPSSFVNFCRLPHQTTLTRSGGRCLIAFKIFRIGTPQENNLILDLGSKEMAADADAQLECGIVSNSQNVVGVKRRRSGSQSNMEEAIVQALTNFSKEGESGNKKRREEVELEALAVQHARIENGRKMLASLAEAHKLAGQVQLNLPPDNRIEGIIQSYYGRLADEMENHISARES